MKNTNKGFSTIYVLIVLVILGLGVYLYSSNKASNDKDLNVTSDKDGTLRDDTYVRSDSDLKTVTFENLGISLEVPKTMFVDKQPLVNLNNSDELESYLFYIQNYGSPEIKDPGNFQMYGSYQFSLPKTTWEQFSETENDLEIYEYVKQIELGGLRGYETKLAGERNNYVYLLMLDDRVLRIAVSQATDENKALADSILKTLKAVSANADSKSGMKEVTEPNGYYSLLIPDTWDYKFNSVAGIRLSDLEASSSDSKVRIEEVDGPHSNIYYESGVVMSFVILEDDSAKDKPAMASITDTSNLYINGIEGTLYRFTEPSTMSGEIQELRFMQNDQTYILRFSYADGFDTEVFDKVIDNLNIPTE